MSVRSAPRIALGCAVGGFPLLLLSYSWVPFAQAGRDMGAWIALVIIGEGGAILAAAAATLLGHRARRALAPGTPEQRLASRAVALGLLLLLLVLVPNLVGVVCF